MSVESKDVIPCRNRPVSDFNVPGWTPMLLRNTRGLYDMDGHGQAKIWALR